MREVRVSEIARKLGLLAVLLSAPPLPAADGRLEIDQDCVATGCFAGDDAGFPVQITAEGSYDLTSNLTNSVASAATVSISASRVALDLNGFAMTGSNLMQTGIAITSSFVEVKNGQISTLGTGISVGNGSNFRFSNLTISNHAGIGLYLGMGFSAHIRDSIIINNGEGIIAANESIIVTGCSVINTSTGDGIRVGLRSIVTDNLVSANAGDGIEIFDSGVVRGNVVNANVLLGINLSANTLVMGNTVTLNGSGNIEACATCTLVDNHVP